MGKSLLRNGYSTALTFGAALRSLLPMDHSQPRVFYGGARPGNLGGTRVKVQRLQAQFPQEIWGCNLIYGLSNAPYLPPIALRLLQARGVRMVVNQNGVFYPAWYAGDCDSMNKKMSYGYHLADHVFWQSNFCRRAADHFLGIRTKAGTVLYNGIDIALFQPQPHVSRKPFKYLLTGKIDVQLYYRLDTTVRGLAAAQTKGLKCELIIAGHLDPWCATELNKLVTELHLQDSVIYQGPYTQAEAPSIYTAADAYVTTMHNDACPNAVIEALACGLPVVHTSTGGLPELVGPHAGSQVETEESWTQVSRPDINRLAEAMILVAEQRSLMAEAARDRAVEAFDIDHWFAVHAKVFELLLEQRP